MTTDHAGLLAMMPDGAEACYLLDLDAFEKNWRAFEKAFADRYPIIRPAYSYKTNYTPALCQVVERLGGYAEVVSGLEYQLARRLGVAPADIIFNGPYKRHDELTVALTAGSLVNVDALYEVALVEQIAGEQPDAELRIALRIAVDDGADTPTRFGLDVQGPDLDLAVERLRRLPNVRLVGLHCHAMPPGRSAEAYGALAAAVVDVARRVFPGSPPELLDLGGGYFSRMSPELQAQFGFTPPTFDDYADAMCAPLRAEWGTATDAPQLVLEPGMAVVADVQDFVCRVIDVKSVRGRTTAQVTGSVYNVRPTKSPRNLPVTLVPDPAPGDARNVLGPVDIVGYTCMEDDILHRGHPGPIGVGDLVVFHNVGAYTLVLAPPFILPQMPVLARSGVTLTQVRAAGDFDEIFGRYRFVE